MGQMRRISKNNTKVRDEDGYTVVRLHSTDVVKFNEQHIILNSGGWRTATTRARMNQASNEYGLGFGVYQKAGEWVVSLWTGNLLPFSNGMEVPRYQAAPLEVVR